MKRIILSPNNNLNSNTDIILEEFKDYKQLVNNLLMNDFYFSSIDSDSCKTLEDIFLNNEDIVVVITSKRSLNLLRYINQLAFVIDKKYSISV